MSISGEAWTIAVIVTATWFVLVVGLTAVLVRRGWNRADPAKRREIRENWRERRTGILSFLPIWILGTGIGVFVISLVAASLVTS